MLSAKLIQMIEEHADTLSKAVVRQLRSNARLPALGQLPEGELRDRALDILRRLGHWLAESNEKEISSHFGEVGRRRAAQHIPLHEVIYGLQLLKRRILHFARDQGIDLTTLQLYAEEELEHQVGIFFDTVIYEVARAYEKALRDKAALLSAVS